MWLATDEGRFGSAAETNAVLSGLRERIAEVETALVALDEGLRREQCHGRLQVVEGPFAGDAAAAVATAHRWLRAADSAALRLRTALENAHISVGGLANGSASGRPGEPSGPHSGGS